MFYAQKSYFLILVIILILTGCKEEVAHYGIEAIGPSFDTLQEMEDYSSTIVCVTRENIETPIVKVSRGEMVTGYTFSQVKIKEIFKDTSNELKIGDTIRILENEIFYEEENAIYHIAGYNMMEEGKEYLLFLTDHIYEDNNPYYVAAGVNYGTVSLEEDNRTTVYLTRNGNQVNDFSEMQPIWDEALHKYANK